MNYSATSLNTAQANKYQLKSSFLMMNMKGKQNTVAFSYTEKWITHGSTEVHAHPVLVHAQESHLGLFNFSPFPFHRHISVTGIQPPCLLDMDCFLMWHPFMQIAQYLWGNLNRKASLCVWSALAFFSSNVWLIIPSWAWLFFFKQNLLHIKPRQKKN